MRPDTPVAPSPAIHPTEPITVPASSPDVDGSLLRGVAWTGGVKWATQLIGWGSTIVVARLLSPGDYGIVGMATLYLGLLSLVSEFGVGTAIVTIRSLTEEQIAQINSISVLLGIAGYVVSLAVSPLLGRFFHEPRLPLVLAVMSLTFVISSFRTVPWALLQRDLRFKRIAMLDGLQALALSIATVILALLGFRYWTLVGASVLSAIMSAAIALVIHRHRFAVPRPRELRDALGLGREVIIQRVAWYAYSNADFLVAGRMLGKDALGAYNLGWTLANLPIEKVGNMVLQVTPSILGTVQHDQPALRRYVLRISEALALVTLPVTFGLALVAPDLVPLALGPKWSSMILSLQILSFYSAVRAMLPLFSQVLIATGESRFGSKNMLAAAVVMPIAFLIGSHWGLTGIALAWLIVHPAIAAFLCARTFRTIALSPRLFFADAIWPALSSGLVMAAAVLALGAALPASAGHAVRLAAQCGTGALVYPAAFLVLHKARVRAVVQGLAILRGKAAAPGAAAA